MATSMVAWGKAICAAAVDPVPVIGRASAFRHYGRRRGRDAAGPGHAVHVRLLRRGVHVLPPRRRRPRDGYLIVGQQIATIVLLEAQRAVVLRRAGATTHELV
ncbi:hypothetical protein EJB05_26711, partial [Eragrostis curvula]